MHIIKLHEVRKKQKNCESFTLYVTFMLYLNLDKEANMKNKNYFILMKYRFNNLYFILPTCKYQKGEGYEYEDDSKKSQSRRCGRAVRGQKKVSIQNC